MRYFTSDWHLGDKRIEEEYDPFFRPFDDTVDNDNEIIINAQKSLTEDDELWHLGDVAIDRNRIKLIGEINCKRKILVTGNHDIDKLEELAKYFDKILFDSVMDIYGIRCYLNHYPLNKIDPMFNIVGHVHGLWKVKRNAVNVGVDCWHFMPVSEKMISFIYNAIKNHYDENVFVE